MFIQLIAVHYQVKRTVEMQITQDELLASAIFIGPLKKQNPFPFNIVL